MDGEIGGNMVNIIADINKLFYRMAKEGDISDHNLMEEWFQSEFSETFAIGLPLTFVFDSKSMKCTISSSLMFD